MKTSIEEFEPALRRELGLVAEQEPTVTLRDGTAVLSAAQDLHHDLLKYGCSLRIVDGDLVLTQPDDKPPLHPDVVEHARLLTRDLAVIISAKS